MPPVPYLHRIQNCCSWWTWFNCHPIVHVAKWKYLNKLLEDFVLLLLWCVCAHVNLSVETASFLCLEYSAFYSSTCSIYGILPLSELGSTWQCNIRPSHPPKITRILTTLALQNTVKLPVNQGLAWKHCIHIFPVILYGVLELWDHNWNEPWVLQTIDQFISDRTRHSFIGSNWTFIDIPVAVRCLKANKQARWLSPHPGITLDNLQKTITCHSRID